MLQLKNIDESMRERILCRLLQHPPTDLYVDHLRNTWAISKNPRIAISENEDYFIFNLPYILKPESNLQYLLHFNDHFYVIQLNGMFGPSAEIHIKPCEKDNLVDEDVRAAARAALLFFDRFGDGEKELIEVNFKN